MKASRIFVILLLFLVYSTRLIGQQPECALKISGAIADDHNKKSLPFSSVLVRETGQGTVADENGYFELDGLCAGPITLEISHIGCETLLLPIQLRKDTALTVYLEHHTELLEAITVVSKKLEAPTSQSKSALEGANLERLQGKSLGESLESISGVSTLQTGPTISKPIIHGLHSSRILILNNGIRQEGQEWGGDHAPEIDPFIANKLSVIKGAATVRYGLGAMSGVVLVEPKALPTRPGVGGQLNLVAMSNGQMGAAAGQLEGGIKGLDGFGWRVQSSLKRAGDLKAPDYQLTNTAMAETNFSGAAAYQKDRLKLHTFYSFFSTELGILRSAHIGNLTDLEAALKSDRPLIVEDFSYDINNPRQAVRHHLLKIDGSWKFDNTGTLSAVYGYQKNLREEYDLRRGGRSDIPALDLDLKTHTLDLVFDHLPFFRQLSGSWGISALYQENRNQPGTGVRPLIPYYNSSTIGAFWVEKWLGAGWQIEGGVRYDLKTLTAKRFDQQNNLITTRLDFSGMAANVGGFLDVRPGLRLKTNLGTTFRPPNVSELFSEGLHHAIAAIEEGDENLQTEKAYKWVSTLEYQHEEKLELEADVYLQQIDNYIYLRPGEEPALTIRGAFPVFKYVQTDARLYGLDLSGQFQLVSHLFLRVNGNIVRGRDIVQEEDLIYLPADRYRTALFYNFTTNARLKDIQTGITLDHTARQKRAPAAIDYAPPPDAYTLLHFEISGNLLLGDQSFGLLLRVNNLLDTAYRNYLDRLRYYADSPGRNIELHLNYHF